MWKCGQYMLAGITDDCYYKDDRCCYYCDKKWECKAKVKCEFECWDDDGDNEDDVNAYWMEDLLMEQREQM